VNGFVQRGNIHNQCKQFGGTMQKQTSLLVGITLIALGILALGGNLLLQLTGGVTFIGFRAWPLIVIGIGLLFCLPPIIFPQTRGLGGLFIPGLPILATGSILFLCSMTGRWDLWATLWPVELLSLAVGFSLAAIFLRVVWLHIPASIVGLNGLVMLFCALTGMWSAWAVLWTVEPLSVGLPLLLIGLFKRIDGVKLAGIILCGFAGLAFAGMSTILVTSWWITRLVGPALVIGLGVLIIAVSMLGQKNDAPETQAPVENVES
jgi:hypothetical protein